MSEELKEQNPGILISRTKEYYEEFCKIFRKLNGDRNSAPRRHYPIDDFQNADHAYSFVSGVLTKTSPLSKSQRECILAIHNAAIVQCVTKYNEEHGNTSEAQERSCN